MWEFAKSMFEEIFGNGAFDKIASVLKLNPSSQLSSAWSAVDYIYSNIMVPVALGLMIIWFLVKMMERSTNEQFTLEQFFLLFVQLIAAKFLIDNGLEIFTKMWSLGISLVDRASSAFGSVGAPEAFDYEELWQDFTGKEWDEKIGIIQSLGIMLKLLLPWIASKIMVACVYFICYSRLIEMMVRMCGAPVALSDFMNEGLHGAGWRYLKNFMAICLQGMLIIIVSRIYSIVYFDVFQSPPEGFWNTILMQLSLSFSAIAIMFKSLSLSKELLGTG